MKENLAEKYVVFGAIADICGKNVNLRSEVQKQSAAFCSDLKSILRELKMQYCWVTHEDRVQVVTEQKEFWNKLGKIAQACPKELADAEWYPIILRAFSTGLLPYAYYYLEAFKISPEDAAPYVGPYLGSHHVSNWVVENWAACSLFKDEIVDAMDKGGFYNADLSRKCRSYFWHKFFQVLLLFAIAGYGFYQTGSYLYPAIFLVLALGSWLVYTWAASLRRKLKAKAKLSELGNA